MAARVSSTPRATRSPTSSSLTYKAGEPKPDLEKLASTEPAAYANRPPDQLNVKKPRRAPAKKKDA